MLIPALIALYAMSTAPAQSLSGSVTIDSKRPLGNAIVKIQAPHETYVTNTDQAGRFAFENVSAEKVVVSVSQDGRLLYRAIKSTHGGSLDIDLHGTDVGRVPSDFAPIGLAVLNDDSAVVFESNGRVLRLHDEQADFLTRVPGSAKAIAAGTLNGEMSFFLAMPSPG